MLATGIRASGLVTQYLAERRDDLAILTVTPGIVDAARTASSRALRLGLDRMTTPELEQRFEASKSLGGDSTIHSLLLEIRDLTDFAEIFFTDRHGFNVLASNVTSDFVQSDEEWWQRAMADGTYESPPMFDESAGVVALEISVRIDDRVAGAPVGVLKGVVQLSRLATLVGSGDLNTTIQVVDSTGRILVARDSRQQLQMMADPAAIPRTGQPTTVMRTRPGGDPEIVASMPTNNGRWWIIATQSRSIGRAASAAITNSMFVTSGLMLVFTLVVLLTLTGWLDRRVTQPVRSAGAVARRIADGDLSVQVSTASTGTDEVGELMDSIHRMVRALRELVGAIRTSSEESAAMAQEISASTEQMSASAQQMAVTCQHLTQQASDQAALIKQTAKDADLILAIAGRLAEGTTNSVARNQSLRAIADDHRIRLLEGSQRLSGLADEITKGTLEAESLASMSVEIQEFVSQARSIAAQTNMLSLNAAIEASRAEGGEGRGFGVVADEVRKLAGQAARGASVTAETVNRILQTVDTTRSRLKRIAEGSTAVQDVAESAASGLKEVADAAAEHSAWTDEISGAADQAQELVAEITQRLRTLSDGTDAFLAAAEQIAATAEEQTASTEEIAGSAGQLADASERLTANVSSFRLIRSGGDGH